ncbi:hypothetical protein D6D10_08964 [Aureobasidium pullulans]|uniref:Uncharacterized protein n=1 Tax=Aureobasidium pullulans TaxID=5580 RepID=A0A4S9E712_AURPU|nr:hypothetical protein D6D10_08964 [Aureobasidium pullulans]
MLDLHNDNIVALDRAAIKQGGQVQPSNQELPHPSPLPHSGYSVRRSFDDHRHAAAAKFRKALHINEPSNVRLGVEAHPILAKDSIPEPCKSRLDHESSNSEQSTVDRLLHNPIDTIKDKISAQGSHQAAADVATVEISHGQEVELVKAQDRVEQAETNDEKITAVHERDWLVKERQNTYVRWTMDRHVTQCRPLPRDAFVKKSRSAFEHKTIDEGTVIDWKAYGTHLLQYYAQQYGGQYIGHGSSPPAPTKESIMPNVERIIIASAPFQSLIMAARKVYRWEDPKATFGYLILYVALLYWDLLLSGMLSAIVYMVMSRQLFGKTIKEVRTDLERTEDQDQAACTLAEYIEKQGGGSWVEKLQEDLGPWLMIQLCDVADLFEILRNFDTDMFPSFYEWRVPGRTVATLSIFLLTILITTFVPTYYLIKSTALGAGMVFFGLFPLASNFPDYRLLASIPRRVFWNIPTHAEWAVKSLQAEGSRYRHDTQTGLGNSANTDYGFYPAHLNKDKGRLIISASSMRFETNIGHRITWSIDYINIAELEKLDRVKSKVIPGGGSGKDLRIASNLADVEGEAILKDMDDRDQAFSQIVGFSEITWQIVW